MPRRRTEEAIAEAASRAAGRPRVSGTAGASTGPGSADPLGGELRRAGLLPLLVLHLLGQEPSYGNQLIERIEALTGGLVGVNPNTMYPLLRRLEADGLAQARWEHPERRSRRFYALTAAGEAERERLRAVVAPKLAATVAVLTDLGRELGG